MAGIRSSALTLLTLTLTLTVTASLTTDGLALLALRSAISHDPTRTLISWSGSDPNPCSWRAITCRRGRVTALHLGDLTLSGYLPFVLSFLSSLQTLDFSHNNLTGNIPYELGNLTALSHLDLSSNRLSGEIPPSIAAIPSLSGVLNLSFNLLSGEIPPEFGHLPVIVSLDLRGNDLSGPIPQLGSLLNQGPTAFAGNPRLCGFPLKNPCGGRNPNLDPDSNPKLPLAGADSSEMRPNEPGERKERRRTSPVATVAVLAAVIVAALISVLVLQWQFRKKRGGEEGRKGEAKEKGGEIIIASEERREGRSGKI